jgi:3-oxoacyl-[acyl-carrier-protein] synthase II
MNLALDDAGISASDVKLVNAHGTSTPLNDAAEAAAMTHVLEHAVLQLRAAKVSLATLLVQPALLKQLK